MIKALPTMYRGIQMRSRLEARWAIFMDVAGVKWDYEPEGFEVDIDGTSVWYLPDFWLPELKAWVEIKGMIPDADAEKKIEALVLGTGFDAYLFTGNPRMPDGSWMDWYDDGAVKFDVVHNDGQPQVAGDYPYWWCVCATCRRVGLAWTGLGNRLACHRQEDDRYHSYEARRLKMAYDQAAGATLQRTAR